MSEKSVYFDRVGSLKDGPGRRALLTVFFGQFAGKSHIIAASDPGLQTDVRSIGVRLGPHAERRKAGCGQGDIGCLVRIAQADFLDSAFIKNIGIIIKSRFFNRNKSLIQMKPVGMFEVNALAGLIDQNIGDRFCILIAVKTDEIIRLGCAGIRRAVEGRIESGVSPTSVNSISRANPCCPMG